MSTSESTLFDEVMSTRQRVRSDLAPLFRRFNEIEELYWFHNNVNKKSAKSNVFDPIAFEQVEHVVSHLFATAPRGRFVAREPSDIEDVGIHNEMFQYQWTHPKQNMIRKIRRTGRTMAKYGIAFGGLFHRYERRVKDGKAVVTFNMPYYKTYRIYDCWPDTDAIDPEDMLFFGVDEWVTLDQLKQSKDRYKNLDKLAEMLKDMDLDQKGSSQGGDGANYQDNTFFLRNMQGRLHHGRFKIARKYTHEKWYTIVPEFGLVIEDQECPYDHGDLPIHTMMDHDQDDQLMAVGEIDPVRSLAIAQNQVINMRFDNVKNILESPFQAKASALRHAHTWKMKRNQIWVVDQIGDVQSIQIPDVTGGTFVNTTNFVQDRVARALGRFDVLTRNETKQDRTATEIEAMIGEQNSRLRYKETNIDLFIQRLATQWLQINQQFLDTATVVRVVNKDVIEALESDEEMMETDIETGQVLPGTVKKVSVPGYDAPIPKFSKSKDGSTAFFAVEPEDIQGSYDYMAESGSMIEQNSAKVIGNVREAIKIRNEVKEELASEGYDMPLLPLIRQAYDALGIKATEQMIKRKAQEMEQQIAQGDDGGQGIEQMQDALASAVQGQGDIPAAMIAGGGMPQGAPEGMPKGAPLPRY